ncbi:MAG: IS5 family transposase [Bryobacteraceae bacterium]
MRGETTRQVRMLAITPDTLVPPDHPIRRIKPIVDGALAELSPLFEDIYARVGRPSIPPEHLLKAQLLMALFSIPSARRFCDQLQYNMLFKWFLDLNVDDPPFHASTFSKNQERLLSQDVARRFLLQIIDEARRRRLLSEEHFSVDGTLLDAWASMKSLRAKGDSEGAPPAGKNPNVDYRGQRRTNETHVSATDPDARLARKGKGQPARLCFAGHVLMEHRSGLAVDVQITRAAGAPEWEVALGMLDRLPRSGRKTVAGDRAYDTKGFVAGCRARGVTPHVAQYPTTKHRRSAIDGRTTRHPGYRVSQRFRKRVEEIFGWVKTVGGGRKLRFIGLARNQFWAEMVAAAYDLVRMVRLEREPALG